MQPVIGEDHSVNGKPNTIRKFTRGDRPLPPPQPEAEVEPVPTFTQSRSNGLVRIRRQQTAPQPEPEPPFIQPPSKAQLLGRR
jgi:hypothetical protein